MVKKSDWVTCLGAPGFVNRVAKDGTWADVRYSVGGKEHVKRMPTSSLTVKHTISIGGGYTVTDMNRMNELTAYGNDCPNGSYS